MKARSLVQVSLASLLGLTAASCGVQQGSNLNASVNESIDQKYASLFDLSTEQSPDLADNLTATKSTLDKTEIGAKVGASFQFGTSVIFDIGANMSYEDVFQRQVLHEVIIGREKDKDGSGDGNGVFIDADTVAANRWVHCKSQKVISDSSDFGASASGGITFLGLGLSTRVGTGKKIASSTDYTMNRGYYKTKENMPLARVFELCGDIAKSDVALQNINHINEIVNLNFEAGENLEELANKVARGEKVNNFQFHNMKMDFEIQGREANKIIYKVHPDTHWADPVLEVAVTYKKDGQRATIESVTETCKSDCQNYHDSERKHGLKRYGEDLTKAQAEKYIRLVATIFTAKAVDSK